MEALAPRGRHRRDLPRARPRARARHRAWTPHGRDVRQAGRLLPRARRLDAPVRRERPGSTAATRSSAAGCRSRSARARRQDAGPQRGHRLLFRRRRGRRGRVPREHEPRRAVEPAGAVLLREQSLRDGHGAGAGRRPRPTLPQGGRVSDAGRRGRRHGCRRGRDAARPAVEDIRAGGGPSIPRVPHLPLPRAFDVRRRSYTATRTRSRPGAKSATRSSDFSGWLVEDDLIHDDGHRRDRSRGGRRDRGRRSRSPKPVRWEPVEDLEALRHDGHGLPRMSATAITYREACKQAIRDALIADPTRLPDGRRRRPLRRLLRGHQGPARRVRPGAHSRHAPVGIAPLSAPGSARRWPGCGRSSRS